MTKQQPDALMSYTRFDDEYDGKALSIFRQRLSGEVRAHTGQPFHIFQDIEDIKWGQQFEQRIDQALATITFFIPILTPSFFNSRFCRYELEKFLQREKRMGRSDLVLPVYYIRVPALEHESLRANDPLAQTIAARQYIDWRELRFEGFDSPNVRRTLAKMAEQIIEALQQPVPVRYVPLPDLPPSLVASVLRERAVTNHPPPRKPQPRKPEWEQQQRTNPAVFMQSNYTPPTHKPTPSNWLILLSLILLLLVIIVAFFAISSRSRPLPESLIPAMVEIPAGPFLMGNRDDDPLADDDEKPQHELTLETYWIGKTEVTNAQFRPFVEGDGYTTRDYWTDAGWQWREAEGITQPKYWDDAAWNSDLQPVVGVSWYEAVAYARWLRAKTGHYFRLPTEAEWEKAARGLDGRIWPWGNEWMEGRANSLEAGMDKTMPVGSYPDGASFYGVLDMAGNAWEWTTTQWRKDYPYILEDEWSADYLEGDTDRAIRGGSYMESHPNIRGALHDTNPPHDRNYFNLSFRLASDSPPPRSTE